MIPEVLKDDVYGFEEMAEILFKANPRLKSPIARQGALLRRLRTRTELPPCAEFEGQYYWPKVAFREWALKRPLMNEVKRVG